MSTAESILRAHAEQAWTMGAFDYEKTPVGSRDWTLFWFGYQEAAKFLAAQPSQRQEPVAWRYKDHMGRWQFFRDKAECDDYLATWPDTEHEELYNSASPPPAEVGEVGHMQGWYCEERDRVMRLSWQNNNPKRFKEGAWEQVAILSRADFQELIARVAELEELDNQSGYGETVPASKSWKARAEQAEAALASVRAERDEAIANVTKLSAHMVELSGVMDERDALKKRSERYESALGRILDLANESDMIATAQEALVVEDDNG